MAKKKSGNKDPLLMSMVEGAPTKGELRKAEIIQAAIECISESGIENLTFESIGKKLGMLKAHVAYHYKSKHEIIDRAVEYAIATAQRVTIEGIKKAQNPEEQLEAYLHGPFEWATQFPQQVDLLVLNLYYSQKDEAHKSREILRRKMGIDRVRAVLTGFPSFAKHPLREQLPEVLQALLTGLLLDFLLEANRMRVKAEYKRLMSAAAKQLLASK